MSADIAGNSCAVAASADSAPQTKQTAKEFGSRLHECPEVMNPPQSAAQGCEARNLNTGDVMGMGHVHRAAKARPADAVPPPLTEEQLETAIDAAKQRLCDAPTRQEKLDAWREMCRLIDQRSPSYVRFLERIRGLA